LLRGVQFVFLVGFSGESENMRHLFFSLMVALHVTRKVADSASQSAVLSSDWDLWIISSE
jgi:hypothetical protein